MIHRCHPSTVRVSPPSKSFLKQTWCTKPCKRFENKPLEVRRLVLETTMFRGELLVSGSVRIQGFLVSKLWFWQLFGFHLILLMAEILHQLIGSLSHYLQGFIHPRWLLGISSINSIPLYFWHWKFEFCALPGDLQDLWHLAIPISQGSRGWWFLVSWRPPGNTPEWHTDGEGWNLKGTYFCCHTIILMINFWS